MLIFSTKLYVKDELTDEKFIKMATEWVTNGHRYTFGKVEWNGEEVFSVENAEKTQKFTVMKYDNAVIVNLINREEQVIWTNDYVLTERNGKRVLAVLLYSEAVNLAVKLPTEFNRPWLLKQIIREKLGDFDNGVETNDKPLGICSENCDAAASLMKGESEYFMPVVYVTPTFGTNSYVLDACELAKDLAGVAHVWVEKSDECAKKLKDMVDGKNPYNGAVKIYYPGGVSQIILPSAYKNSHVFRREVAYSVFRKLILSRIDGEFSWNKIRYENLMEENKGNLELFELSEKMLEEESLKVELGNSRIEELENEIASLQAKVQMYEYMFNKSENKDNVIALKSQERDLYDDEIKDVILRVLEKELNLMSNDPNQKEWRKYHVLKSILQSNSLTGTSEVVMQVLREVLNDDGSFNGAKRRRLYDLGFEIEEGKHFKVTYHGDDRYMITISKTPSDYRNNLNAISAAKNTLF